MGSGRTPSRLITKRACVRLTLLLVAGAIVNVAVAWGAAVASTASNHWGFRQVDEWSNTLRWNTFAPIGWPESSPWAEATLEGWTRSVVVVTDSKPAEVFEYDEASNYRIIFVKMGWPMRSLRGELWQSMTGEDDFRIFRTALDASVFVDHASERPLPLRPVWPGFAINTMVYAAILWLLVAAPFAWRRRRRVKCGFCVKCAYDLRGDSRGPTSDTCPECGWRAT